MESFVNLARRMTKFRPHPITLTSVPMNLIDKVTITNGIRMAISKRKLNLCRKSKIFDKIFCRLRKSY